MIRNTIADSVVNGPVVQIGSGNVTLALARLDVAEDRAPHVDKLARMTVARLPEVAFNPARSSVVVARRDKVRALELVREAIGIQRPPAAFRPDRHLLELAGSSVLLARGQVGAGPPSDALPEALEHAFSGVRAYDHLARLGTIRRADHMPGAVAVPADVLDALGRSEEAAAFREGFASATAERPNG